LASTSSLEASDSSKVFISGLLDTTAPNGPTIPISYKSANTTFGSTGLWDRATGTLVLTLTADLNVGLLIIFPFQLTNPSAQHDAASVMIAASGTIAIAPESFFSDFHSTLEPGTVAGDAAPLKVYQPFFIVAKSVGTKRFECYVGRNNFAERTT
jgi:hypothetical protein